MKNNLQITLLITLPLILALILLALYYRQPQEYKSEEFLMDTLVSISTYGTNTDLLQKATHEAFLEMRRIAQLTDRFTESSKDTASLSDVNKINSMAGIQPVKVDEDVFQMIQTAKDYYVLTEGAFDITIGPLMDLWGFGGEPHLPDDQELQETLALVDGDKLIIDKSSRTIYLSHKGMSLDLGAVAKGYAVEKAASILEKHGITKALINAGGNIRVLGERADNNPWMVGIQDPRVNSELVGVIKLSDGAATTSGDYNRTFTIADKQYHHIISPLTGYPAKDNISITVLTPDAFTGDLLSTALFLLDSEKALRLAETLPKTDVFIVTAQKDILLSPGLINKIEIKATERYSYDKY
ncbi:MAG: ApbE family lipoprotein [Firmicutes bacterium HGW-Firmicutes-12]|jgi:thiamine biosynthesis lipoprotein|nr:MAG: ApbE family lipoprotein [Firmicutes bacterium HGW-Firmicutes-12]